MRIEDVVVGEDYAATVPPELGVAQQCARVHAEAVEAVPETGSRGPQHVSVPTWVRVTTRKWWMRPTWSDLEGRIFLTADRLEARWDDYMEARLRAKTERVRVVAARKAAWAALIPRLCVWGLHIEGRGTGTSVTARFDMETAKMLLTKLEAP